MAAVRLTTGAPRKFSNATFLNLEDRNVAFLNHGAPR
jgi:hypothetical protein